VLVAVSGGLDSMVLLHLLASLAEKPGWQLAVAHFNHRLRGRSSDADERLVRQTTQRLGLRCVCGSGDVRTVARRKKISIEMAARELRQKFLARTARRLSCSHIALAHHADDQVELFFLRLFRGAGSDGLAGMAWSNPSPADAKLTLVRPLLGTPKSALSDYARKHGIAFREDASNANRAILRNRIRHRLLPLLREEFQPALAAVIGRVMEALAGEAEVTADEAARWLRLRRPDFARLPVAVQRACLASELRQLDCEPDFVLIEKLRAQAEVPVMVRPGVRVRRGNGTGTPKRPPLLQLDRAVRAVTAPRPRGKTRLTLRLPAAGGGTIGQFGGLALELRRLAGRARPPWREGVEFFDAGAIGARILLRHWQAGDRFQPIGLPEPVKLQDLFTNAKVPREERHWRVVAEAADGRIFWVEGLRIGEAFKVTPATRQRLRWAWRRATSSVGPPPRLP
jgi:tRNA(Ile)-lysidine synthase